MKNQNHDRLSYSLLRVIWKITEIDKQTRYYGTDQPLFWAEIHMIKAIRENQNVHVTGLANYLDVTKGAVSQILKKLQKKGMIAKEKDANNQSRILLSLTPKGETAYRHHEKFHRTFDDIVSRIIKSQGNENVLRIFFQALEKKIDIASINNP